MKTTVSLFFFFFVLNSLSAQTAYTFEAISVVPSQWVASSGLLSLSSEHFKEGSQSLCWKTTGKSVLTLTPSSTYMTSAINGIDFQLHSPTITNDTLKVEFYSAGMAVKTMQVCMNYKGWRDIFRAYTEFVNISSVSISKIQFTLLPTNKLTERTFYFDAVNLSSTTPSSRILGTQWKIDTLYFANSVLKGNLERNSYSIDIDATLPVAKELSGLNSLKSNSVFNLLPVAGNAAELTAAIKFGDSLTISRNLDGTVRGLPLSFKDSDISVKLMTTFSRNLEVLAADGTASTTRFNNLLDHLLDQGFAEGIPYFQMHNDYPSSRAIAKSLLNILPSCNTAQRDEVLKLCKWILLYGDFYIPQGQYLDKMNSDKVYLFCNYFVQIALNQPTSALSVRELKAFKRWLDRNGEYIPGNRGFLKADGTGFHHEAHLNGYMRAYKSFVLYMKYLNGTPFQVEKITYEHLKKAILSQFIQGSLNSDKSSNEAYSLSGRAGYADALPCSSYDLDYLISVGTDLYGSQDNELAAAYNYFFQSTKYTVPSSSSYPSSYSGFYAYNYSPVCIYRQGNWVATMRSPTKTVKGSEIFGGANCFGRYQSHGTLEVLYDGLIGSGYPVPRPAVKTSVNPTPIDTTGAGWDWNVVPGATTVHYTNWKDMMPNQNGTSRFDQYTKSKTFSGGLSWGDKGMGLFACDFDQIDTWGGSKDFTPTNLVFKKSVLAVDSLLIDIGTNIGSSGTYASTLNTATNLFQSVISTTTNTLVVNGTSISSTYSSPLAANTANTLISPAGTGYIIPKGNDLININYGLQKTPIHTGSDVLNPTFGLTVAKAYIVHGKNPTNKSYQFVVVPGATAQTLASTASNVNAGLTYQLVNADSNMHVIYYKPRNIMAYTFFKPVANVNDTAFHVVKSISTEGLLLERKSTVSNTAYDFAMANPDMLPITDSTFGWLSSPTTTVLTLKGKWLKKTSTSGISLISSSSVETKIQAILTEGFPQYFTVDVDTSLSNTALEEGVAYAKPYLFSEKNILGVNLGYISSREITITFIYTDGTFSATKKYIVENGMVMIPNPPLHAGLNLVKINAGGETIVLKTIH